MASWKTDDHCMVSIICTTYNHELYIQDALESFLMQETDFPFEIIIHDDASTDDTPTIIRKYSSLYPEIVKPIFQIENQYSKGAKIVSYAANKSSGKYIALCEGDDYWINKNKLQIQLNAMQKNPEVDFSFHSAYPLRNEKCAAKAAWDYGYDRIFYPDSILSNREHAAKSVWEYWYNRIFYPDLIFNVYNQFAPTASFFFKREVIESLPRWFFEKSPVGDFFYEMYGAKRGGVLYIHKPMSIYRVMSNNSWSSNMGEGGIKRFKHSEMMLECLQLLENDFPNYPHEFEKKRSAPLYSIAIFYLVSKDDILFKKYLHDSVNCFRFFSIKQRFVYRLRYMPFLLRLLYFFKKNFRKNTDK